MKKSNWSFYLKLLPPDTLSPIGYAEDLLNLLRIDESYDFTRKRIARLKQSFSDLRKLVFSIPQNVKEKFIGKLSFNDYVWARLILKSNKGG